MPSAKGPYFHKPTGKWRIRVDGHDVYHDTREEAEAALAELRGDGGDPLEVGTTAPVGSRRWWDAVIAASAARICERPGDTDARGAGRVLAALAGAADRIADSRELEQLLGKLQARYAELTSAQKHSAQVRRPVEEPAENGAPKVLRRDEAVFDRGNTTECAN